MSRDGWAALPHGATGLSAVCDCGISWSYSFTILVVLANQHSVSHFLPVIYLLHARKFFMVIHRLWLFASRWVRLQTLWWFRLKDLSIDEMVGAWCFCCLSGPLGFLRFWVVFTVESLSLLYLLFIAWFICSGRWCFDKLGVFHANQTSMCLN